MPQSIRTGQVGELAARVAQTLLREVGLVVERVVRGVAVRLEQGWATCDDSLDGCATHREPQCAVPTHRPAVETELVAQLEPLGEHRHQLVDDHRGAVGTVRPGVPVRLAAAVDRRDRERRDTVGDGLGEEPVDTHLVEGRRVIGTSTVQGNHERQVDRFEVRRQ
ncbi:hypothetical protein ABIE44_001002 [Marmoricola sp. OAE513]